MLKFKAKLFALLVLITSSITATETAAAGGPEFDSFFGIETSGQLDLREGSQPTDHWSVHLGRWPTGDRCGHARRKRVSVRLSG